MDLSFLSVLLCIAIIILINRSNKEIKFLSGFTGRLMGEIDALKKEILTLKQVIEDFSEGRGSVRSQAAAQSVPEETEEPDQIPEVAPLREPVHTIKEEAITNEPLSEPLIVEEVAAENDIIDVHAEGFVTEENVPTPSEENVPVGVYPEAEDWYSRWLRNNPDLEKFIGENLINKVGIAILVLGIAFFVKYAIDQDWINEVGRVCIGMGCGALLVGLAHYLRNGYRSFSSVLAGGGVAVFYFTIAFAFHKYHLMPQTAAFIIMVIVTAFAVALSVLYDRLELAIIASVGGFITPFLVSTGDGNYVVLFTYLIILNIGLLALAWFKRWSVLNLIALLFTELIYGGWLSVSLTGHKPFSIPLALSFATVFYFIFMSMNMIYQVRTKEKFKALDFSILMLISGSYYAAGMVLLHDWNNGSCQGIFTLGVGAVNLLLAYYVHKSGKADRNLLFLLIGLTLSFVTLTIPIQLHGHAITMFWSVEFVLLYWLSVYSGIRLFRYSSALMSVLTLFSLFMDWDKVNTTYAHSVGLIFNNAQGVVTNIIAIAAFFVYFLLVKKNGDDEPYMNGIKNKYAGNTMLIISVGLFYVTGIYAVNLTLQTQETLTIPNVYHSMITIAFGLTLLVLMQKNVLRCNPVTLQLLPLIVCFIFYIVSTGDAEELRDGVLHGRYSWLHVVGHFISSVLFLLLYYRSILVVRRNKEDFERSQTGLGIFFSLLVIVFFSIELMHVYILVGFQKNNLSELTSQYGKAGLTVIWGICSFILMWIGMKHKQKNLRILSLTLFAIVLLKLFIFDISGISEGGKIFAFILLGVLFLVVSFMYQKLKKIIIDDGKG